MKKRMIKKDRPCVSAALLERVYRALPFLFLVMSLLNVWFLYSYVQSDKSAVVLERDKLLASTSNLYHFVQVSLSNQIERARHSRDFYSAPIFTRGLSVASTNVSSSASSSVPVSSAPVFKGNLPCWYAVVHGRDCVTFGGARYYSVGSDFGYGVVQRITRLSVVCSGVAYRLANPPVFLPSPSFLSPSPRPMDDKKEITQNG